MKSISKVMKSETEIVRSNKAKLLPIFNNKKLTKLTLEELDTEIGLILRSDMVTCLFVRGISTNVITAVRVKFSDR